MIGYGDKTYCSYYRQCKDFRKCRRGLTKKVLKDALAWTREFKEDAEGALVAQYATRPHCFNMKRRNEA